MASEKDYVLPQPPPARLLPNDWKNTEQQKRPKAPLRALRIKGAELRAAVRTGNTLDWTDIHDRYVDLWQEARLTLWRAKHSKAGPPQNDPVTGKKILTFVPDEKLVLQTIDTTRALLDSMVKIRREMGHEASGIPRWAIERISSALRDHPSALNALLKDLAADTEKLAE